jgi:CBS domain containing-hemolysin-like protein
MSSGTSLTTNSKPPLVYQTTGGGRCLLHIIRMLAVRDANRQLKLKLPEDDGYTTLAGFLMTQTGRLLEAGETVEYEDLRFTVERMNKRRIRRVRLTLPKKSL